MMRQDQPRPELFRPLDRLVGHVEAHEDARDLRVRVADQKADVVPVFGEVRGVFIFKNADNDRELHG